MATLDELLAQRAELDKQIRDAQIAEEKAARFNDATRAVSLLALLKATKSELDRVWPGLFDGERWEAFNTATAWPRATSMKKAADLSETEVGNAAHRGAKAVEKLAG